jgi:hypothetical protein
MMAKSSTTCFIGTALAVGFGKENVVVFGVSDLKAYEEIPRLTYRLFEPRCSQFANH